MLKIAYIGYIIIYGSIFYTFSLANEPLCRTTLMEPNSYVNVPEHILYGEEYVDYVELTNSVIK